MPCRRFWIGGHSRCLILTAVLSSVSSVGPGYAQEINRYEVVYEPMTWLEASYHAESVGGHLVTIQDEQENRLVMSLARQAGLVEFWIGLTDQLYEGEWRWVTGEPATFTRWGEGEPSNASFDEDFALVSVPGRGSAWIDTLHDEALPFVVEFEVGEPLPLAGGPNPLAAASGEGSPVECVFPEPRRASCVSPDVRLGLCATIQELAQLYESGAAPQPVQADNAYACSIAAEGFEITARSGGRDLYDQYQADIEWQSSTEGARLYTISYSREFEDAFAHSGHVQEERGGESAFYLLGIVDGDDSVVVTFEQTQPWYAGDEQRFQEAIDRVACGLLFNGRGLPCALD